MLIIALFVGVLHGLTFQFYTDYKTISFDGAVSIIQMSLVYLVLVILFPPFGIGLIRCLAIEIWVASIVVGIVRIIQMVFGIHRIC